MKINREGPSLMMKKWKLMFIHLWLREKPTEFHRCARPPERTGWNIDRLVTHTHTFMFDPECVFFIFRVEAIWKPDYCRVNMKPDATRRRRPSNNLQRYTHISHQTTLYQQARPLSFATDLLLVERRTGILLSDRFSHLSSNCYRAIMHLDVSTRAFLSLSLLIIDDMSADREMSPWDIATTIDDDSLIERYSHLDRSGRSCPAVEPI